MFLQQKALHLRLRIHLSQRRVCCCLIYLLPAELWNAFCVIALTSRLASYLRILLKCMRTETCYRAQNAKRPKLQEIAASLNVDVALSLLALFHIVLFKKSSFFRYSENIIRTLYQRSVIVCFCNGSLKHKLSTALWKCRARFI